ncbi:hypothetical protein LWI29_037991 [Acer saccharum]|uniref:Reverse transcriptase/retrotransposon-derived protein RNase H-like domain-containing protein n=1 Tax=Acer saccharum TaxID=4024 RepID=A0AA39W3K0_ACESA|nr:hypothetical protein LWI29_037991 [Acer saccharum]
MYALSSLDKLCATQRFFSKMLTEGKKLQSQCKQPSLQIKYKSLDFCTYKTKKKNHFKHFKNKKGSSKRFKFFRKKAKWVPSDADIESIFSEQDHADHTTTFVLQEDLSDSEYFGSSNYSSIPESYQATQFISQPGPQAPVRILPDKYSKPVDVIAYFNTSSHTTMKNPKVLPPEFWKSQVQHFRAADGNVFSTNLISRKKIGIQFFPFFTLWVQVIGTPLPDKDILLGWDVFYQSKSLRILPTGIRYKKNFKVFSNISKIFPLSEIQAPFELIQNKLLLLYANSHATFSHLSPLWKNPDFFIKLPFKLNEDNNPTKATHSGMSPSDLQLANEECNELLRQGLIEHISSPWACQAFYVEKCSELLKGKKRLVVDYQPLNLFLRDDKFPVPRPNVLFSQLPGATIFSKFDLKGAFWQIVLSTLLNKRPPPWNSTHTEAIIKLKEISQSPPALTIPSSGQLILQTDANDIFWDAVLIEDRDSQRRYCGHASGKFNDA